MNEKLIELISRARDQFVTGTFGRKKAKADFYSAVISIPRHSAMSRYSTRGHIPVSTLGDHAVTKGRTLWNLKYSATTQYCAFLFYALFI